MIRPRSGKDLPPVEVQSPIMHRKMVNMHVSTEPQYCRPYLKVQAVNRLEFVEHQCQVLSVHSLTRW